MAGRLHFATRGLEVDRRRTTPHNETLRHKSGTSDEAIGAHARESTRMRPRATT